MKLAVRRKSKVERAIDATGDLAKLWAGTKLTKKTARAGRKAAGATLAGKAAKGTVKRRGGAGRGGRKRKLLLLGGAAGAVALALKARKGESPDQAATWTPPDVPVGGTTAAGGTVPPGPTSVDPTGAANTATLGADAPNVGATGLAPEAARDQTS